MFSPGSKKPLPVGGGLRFYSRYGTFKGGINHQHECNKVHLKYSIYFLSLGQGATTGPQKRSIKNIYQKAKYLDSRVIPGTFNNGTPLWEVSHTIPIPLP